MKKLSYENITALRMERQHLTKKASETEYNDPNDFPIAIGILNEAIEAYPFKHFGWKRSDNAPYLGMGAETKTGARTAVPVEKI